MRSDVSRLMVEIAVRQALKNRSKQSFRRSLRTLVEYGEHYSSGPFQSSFFVLVQQMLRDEEHPYYSLAERAWAEVDPRYIEHFCLNVGYESWTCGAATIRALESQLNCNIPWCLTLRRSEPEGDVLSEEHLRAVIDQGMAMGIYTYIYVDCQLDTALLSRLSNTYTSCALVALTQDSRLTEGALDDLEGTDNVLLIALQDGPEFTSAPLLRRHRRPYGLCMLYQTPEDVRRVLCGEALAFPGDADCMLPCFYPTVDCPANIRQAVDAELLRRKEHPVTAQFPVELSQDLRRIDQIISTDDCALSVSPQGEFLLTEPLRATGMYIQSSTLEQVIRQWLRKD